MNTSYAGSAYGLWSLVVINSLVFIIFAFSFARPRVARDWRSLGGFSAFVLALFTEMYGFPLTIYFLLPWLTTHFPGIDFLSHDAGHLFETIFRPDANPHFGPFHMVGNLLIFAGFFLLYASWRVLHPAQRAHRMATTGPYQHIRHPQYAAFVLIMAGFLLQWPTLLTLAMFPVLVLVYLRLAHSEEREALASFGEDYRRYMETTPAFIPRIGRQREMKA
jgi:methanethiol S-methyltransferase